MRKWLGVLAALVAVGGLGHYLALHDPNNSYLGQSADNIITQGRTLTKKWIASNRPGHKGFLVIANDEVSQTRAALETIRSDAPQFAEAQRLLMALQQQEEVGKKAMQVAIAKSLEDDVDGRKEFVHKLESDFLKNGMDVRLTTGGAKATILNFRYVLVSRPFLYKLANESALLQNAKRVGFTRVHFTDGYGATANYDLNKNKFD